MEYRIRELRSLEAVGTLRSAWARWQCHPNSDLDHYLLICQSRRDSCEPYVLCVEDSQGPVAILAGRIEVGELAPSIGYIRPLRISVRRLAVIHQGVLGAVDERVANLLVERLLQTMQEDAIDVIELFHLPEASVVLQSSLIRIARWWRDRRPRWSEHWELTLPREQGGLLRRMSSKHRSWIRRKERELEGAYRGHVEYRTFREDVGIDQLCCELESVSRLSYQRKLGGGYIDSSEERARFALFASRGQLRAWTLRVGDVPRAYGAGVAYRDRFHFFVTGYDPAFRGFEVGTLLFCHMVDALSHEGLAVFDFGLGDASYKQRFGDRSWREGTMRLYPRSVQGLLTRCAVGMVESAAEVGNGVARWSTLLNKVRTGWRRRLASRK